MFANQSSNAPLDEDLDVRRYKNDQQLKSRFESIFEKYSQDFDGIGDEIDLFSGRIVVDNGHLKSMRTETDLGVDEEDGRGKAFLRAMTEAPDSEDSDFNENADNVLDSIEEIAENAVLIISDSESDDSMSTDESEDELFRPPPSCTPLATPPDSRGNESMLKSVPVSIKSESDIDPLFHVPVSQRGSSPDSLFEVPSPPPNEANHFSSQNGDSSLIDSPFPSNDPEEGAILARYGPKVGYEVIGLLQRERENAEAHIEPAWRIPSNVIPPNNSTSPAIDQNPPDMPSLQRPQDSEDQEPFGVPPSITSDSLWRVPTTIHSNKMAERANRRRVLRLLREESEDPLQDGFVKPHEDDGNGNETERGQENRDVSQTPLNNEPDDKIQALQQGLCYYCGQKYTGRSGVVSHWTHLVNRFLERDEVDDVHDISYILTYRQSVRRRQRGQRLARLIVSDFRTLVELHEGGGLSFAEIADCGKLHTRKGGPGLALLYDKWRTASEHDKGAKNWSSEELTTLRRLCKDPKSDVGTFPTLLKGRSETEIGGKLAEMWLRELREAIRPSQDKLASPTPFEASAGSINVDVSSEEQEYRRGSTADSLFIKQEEDGGGGGGGDNDMEEMDAGPYLALFQARV